VWLSNGDTIKDVADASVVNAIAVARNHPAIAIGDLRGAIRIHRPRISTTATARQIVLACQITEGYALEDEKIEDAFVKRHSHVNGLLYQPTDPDIRPDIPGLQKLDEWQVAELQKELDSLGGIPKDLWGFSDESPKK
jgi:hypothetical protein